MFSDKSDVWAFGITLWELFTLGTEPYPGINHGDLYSKLMSGYRMEKPIHSNRKMYIYLLT